MLQMIVRVALGEITRKRVDSTHRGAHLGPSNLLELEVNPAKRKFDM